MQKPPESKSVSLFRITQGHCCIYSRDHLEHSIVSFQSRPYQVMLWHRVSLFKVSDAAISLGGPFQFSVSISCSWSRPARVQVLSPFRSRAAPIGSRHCAHGSGRVSAEMTLGACIYDSKWFSQVEWFWSLKTQFTRVAILSQAQGQTQTVVSLDSSGSKQVVVQPLLLSSAYSHNACVET